ncbi:cell death specification protein 2 [Elysia marginata]|uniref:Cell death specification protein 2 n=1 Tax=Elysia marginata TaxID=1093978 RepID=A0AAV4H3Y6_9GAST|nr:cell death specification protein 2 [Elysia marginata]
MSEGALDLSISSQPPQRAQRADQGGSDSGRASTDSTSSDHHDDVLRLPRVIQHQQPLQQPQHRVSPIAPHSHASQILGSSGSVYDSVTPRSYNRSPIGHERDPAELVSPNHLYKPPAHLLPTFTSTAGGGRSSPRSSPPPQHQPQHSQLGPSPALPGSPPPPPPAPLAGQESFNDGKPPLHALASDRISTTSSSATNPDARVAPIRPFKMYPVDPFNVYSPSLLPGGIAGTGGGGTLSPTPMGLQSLYDSASPTSFPSFPLTHLTSHLLQRKRRAESRSDSSNSSSGVSSGGTTTVATSNSTQAISTSSSGIGDNSGSVTTSSPASPGKRSAENDSAGSDSEKRMRASPTSNDPSGGKKDDAYWDRRRKNNEAAKRSRDARRQKEEEIAMRAAFLEQENLKLRAQVAILKNETAKLHYMLYNRI